MPVLVQETQNHPMSGPDQDGTAERMALLRCHVPTVLGVCLAHTRNRSDAEDLMQETFLKAIASIDDLRDHRSIRSWLLQIARRVCINHFQRHRTMQPLPEAFPATAQAPDPRLEWLQAVLPRLPLEYREALTIYYLDGRNSAAVAEALGISESGARMRLTRARRMLQEMLEEDEQ
jgi:RNA polymerase sigma-70 factor (ECF subfamily)